MIIFIDVVIEVSQNITQISLHFSYSSITMPDQSQDWVLPNTIHWFLWDVHIPAQFSPLLFYWMVSWWPKWLHGTFLPLSEGNWQVCNYLFNEADLLGPVENIIRDVSTFWPSQRIIKINTEW